MLLSDVTCCFQMSHVVREIQHFQQTSYRIDHRPRVGVDQWQWGI